MSPAGQLAALAARKAFLRERSALRRARAVIEAHRVARPLHTADALLAQWRQLSPLLRTAAVPLALWTARKATRRRGLLGSAWRWAPVLLATWRELRARRR